MRKHGSEMRRRKWTLFKIDDEEKRAFNRIKLMTIQMNDCITMDYELMIEYSNK